MNYAAGASAHSAAHFLHGSRLDFAMILAFAGLPAAVPVLGCSRLSESPSRHWLTSHQPGTAHRQLTGLPLKYAASASALALLISFMGADWILL